MSTNPLGRWLGLSGSNGKGSASSAAALDRNRLRLTASALITIGLGLALVEIWALSALAGAQHYAGVVVGAVAVATLMGLSAIVKDEPGVWARGAVAALATVVEVLVSLSAVVTVSAIIVRILPESVSADLLDSDRTNEFILLIVLGMGMVVAARGWYKFSKQLRRATEASVEAERARAQAAERERELVRSELTVLRAQIEPHFLWNTLAHVQHLTRKSPKDAEAMTGHLIRFLRATVPNERGNGSTLGSEMASAHAYLELMRIRMGERLTIHVDLDPGIADAAFPPLLIQTLVENAIKHGIEPKVGPVEIQIRASLKQVHTGHPDTEREILVEVIDNGVGLMGSPPTKGTGMGLRNVRERLRLIYGTEASLRIAGRADGGVVARIQTPLTWADVTTDAGTQ